MDRTFENILIVGGGSNSRLLNQSVANTTGKVVLAGPSDATGIGNILNQLISLGEIDNLHTGREMIVNSFPIQQYLPER